MAIVSLSLLSGDCPDCSPPLPLRIPFFPYFAYAPGCRDRCIGQNGTCRSCSRPLAPGGAPFYYRQDFNYPWSQAPLSLRPPCPPMLYDIGPEENYLGPEELPTPEARRKLNKSLAAVPAPMAKNLATSAPRPIKYPATATPGEEGLPGVASRRDERKPAVTTSQASKALTKTNRGTDKNLVATRRLPPVPNANLLHRMQ